MLAINFLFLLEIIFKLFAFPPRLYFTDFTVVVDLIVTVIYFALFAVDCTSNGQFIPGGPELEWTNRLEFLNCFRTFKIFELLKQLSKFKVIIQTITSTLKETPNYLLIMFIFIYVFALLGL